jgi:uncharacterized protein involved in type VI secretion and phage assembly
LCSNTICKTGLRRRRQIPILNQDSSRIKTRTWEAENVQSKKIYFNSEWLIRHHQHRFQQLELPDLTSSCFHQDPTIKLFQFSFRFFFQNKNINRQPKTLKTTFTFMMSHQNIFPNKRHPLKRVNNQSHCVITTNSNQLPLKDEFPLLVLLVFLMCSLLKMSGKI